MKRNVIISSILLLMIIGVGIYYIYGTLAVGTSTSEGEVYRFDITDDSTTVTVPANSSKIVFFKIKNTNSGTVRYGIGYTNKSNIEVLAYNDGFDEMTGLIKKNEYKFIKLRVINNSSSSQSTKISTILGYENGGDLIVPSDKGLVNEEFSLFPKVSKYITDLYNNASKTTVTNNSITYNYASSISLMNDRLGGTTTSLDGGNIRYYGANPNNYIYFNCSDYNNQSADTCELWRIIGVFKDIGLADGTKKDLVKIIRNESIGSYSWDNKDMTTGAKGNFGKSDWSTARLMKLLNPSDYYTVDPNDNGNGQSLYWNSVSGTCFSRSNNATKACDFTSTGIKNDATRNRIVEVIWNLGGWIESYYIYSNQIYAYERGTEVISGRPTIWTGKIALMYPSDYSYATDFTRCSQSLENADGNSACHKYDWLFNSAYQWLLTPNSDSEGDAYGYNTAWCTEDSFLGAGCTLNASFEVRPTLFLNAKEVITEGDGSSSNPFKLGA